MGAGLDALLVERGWRILGGTRLFRLAGQADAEEAFRRLLQAGILFWPQFARTLHPFFGVGKLA